MEKIVGYVAVGNYVRIRDGEPETPLLDPSVNSIRLKGVGEEPLTNNAHIRGNA